MLIGEVARRSGLSAHTIRFYEARGLLTRPTRRASGYRMYSTRVLDELRFVERAQLLGFTLNETREILSMGRSGRMPCERVAVLCATHLSEIDRRMAELRAFRRNLHKAQRFATRGCGFTPEGFCQAVVGDSNRMEGPRRRAVRGQHLRKNQLRTRNNEHDA